MTDRLFARRKRGFDFDQSKDARFSDSALLSKGRRTMTTETMLIVGAITAAFVGFALTLWWAERQSRDANRS
jgi:hypothetical protein